uniref:ATP-binding protein n=1 Tax=Candidatus Ruminimicrobium bovinum TaxID=3242779 RepID=UPI0039B9666B
MEENKKLEMSFELHTIEHLGVKMYSVLPNAIAELIANAYDAEANNVYIKLYDREGNKSIVVIDDGLGMSFDELNDKFLHIGRKRRIEDNGMSPNGLRKVTGRKGLGKLAFFGIGDTIRITTKKDGKKVEFSLNWSEIKNSTASTYEPKFKISDCNVKEIGTEIELTELKRKSSFNKESLSLSLSKLFNFFDSDFKVYISINDDNNLLIDNKLKYENLDKQIEWILPNNNDIKNEYLDNKKVSGCIIATEKPLKPGLRGITLFAHGRLVNVPEFFGVGESSHGYSYLMGWLNVDFIDELEEDVISTDRQSLNWDLPITNELRNNLQRLLKDIEIDWRAKRKIEKQKQILNKSKINFGEWYSKLPRNIKTDVEKIVDSVYDSELTTDKQNNVIDILHGLIPEYVNYHWRHIHPTIRDASFNDYKKADFYRAVLEA